MNLLKTFTLRNLELHGRIGVLIVQNWYLKNVIQTDHELIMHATYVHVYKLKHHILQIGCY